MKMKKRQILPQIMRVILMGSMSVGLAGCGSPAIQGTEGASAQKVSTAEASAENAGQAASAAEGETGSSAASATSGSSAENQTESAMAPLHFTSKISYPSEENVDSTYLSHGRYTTLAVSDEGYDALNQSLSSLSSDTADTVEKDVTDFAAIAKELLSDDPQEQVYDLFYSYADPGIVRADPVLTSILMTYTSYADGAHPNSWYGTFNYDSSTGEELELSDVVEDMDTLPQKIADKLFEDYDADIFMNYEDADALAGGIADMISDPSANGELCWTLGYNGISFYFGDYALAAYAEGHQICTLSFAEYPDLIKAAYQNIPSEYITPVYTDLPMEYTMEDNTSASVIVTQEWKDEQEAELSVTCRTGKGEDKTDTASPKTDIYAFDFHSYLVHTKSATYVYTEVSEDDDYHDIYIFNITSPERIKAEPANFGRGFTDIPTDPAKMNLCAIGQIICSASYYSYFRVSDSGMPEITTPYDYILPVEDHETLTLRKDLEAEILTDETSGATEKETLPKGSKLTFYRADAADPCTFADMKMEDGRIVRLRIENPQEAYTVLVDGEKAEDLFDGLFYAG